MKDIWFISDTHFGHSNILGFIGLDGNLIRPGFAFVEEMDERMVENWNAVVKDQDRVYHLGDVMMNPASVPILGRLKGSKRLLVGNHDSESLKLMAPYFKKIGLWRIFKDEGFTCSHMPLREEQFRHKTTHNVHGHIHERLVRLASGEPDPIYINVSVEQTDYRPVHMDEILSRIAKDAPIHV